MQRVHRVRQGVDYNQKSLTNSLYPFVKDIDKRKCPVCKLNLCQCQKILNLKTSKELKVFDFKDYDSFLEAKKKLEQKELLK
jgi:hypothetical protein